MLSQRFRARKLRSRSSATTALPNGRALSWRRRAGLVLAAGSVAATTVYGLGPGGAAGSSHREAPLVAADPAIDNTDLYAFVSPERPDYVTFVANWQPFSEPNGGPNFYPFATDARYVINVDNNGDAKPDAIFRWTFKNIDKRGNDTFLYNNGPVTSIDDENLLFRQTYTLETSFNGAPFVTRVSDAPVAPSRVGAASMPDYGALRDQAIYNFEGGWKGYAGQADDPFFLDLRVFDLLYGGDLSEVGQDTLAGYNVNTIALQVPFTDVALKAGPEAQPGDRRVEHDRAARHPDGQRPVLRRLGAGLPARPATGERGRRPFWTEGRLQLADPGQGRHHPAGGRAGHRSGGAETDRVHLQGAGAADSA